MNIHKSIPICLAFSLCLGAGLAVQPDRDADPDKTTKLPYENLPQQVWEEILPGLYRWADTCNVYVLKRDDAALLFDLGDGTVLERLHEIGVERVEWVLFTHHHREQCQGALLLPEETRIAGPQEERGLFESPNEYRKMEPRLGDVFTVYGASYARPPVHPIRLDRGLASGDRFEWRGYSIYCLSTPGNSPGGMTYGLKLDDGRVVLFSGDVVLDGARMHTWYDTEWDYGFGKGVDVLRSSVERMMQTNPDLLLPAHGPAIMDPATTLPEYHAKLVSFFDLYKRGYPVHNVKDAEKDAVSKPTTIEHLGQVTPHIYKLIRPNEGSNFGIILSDGGHGLVVDCGLMDWEFMHGILEEMRDQLNLKSIDAMLITHMHGDHFLLGERLRQAYGAEMWTLDKIADTCAHPERYDYAAMIQSYGSGIDALPIDRRLKDGEVIEWEGLRLQVDWMPGQTEFGCCLWLDIDGKRVAFTGDNIFGYPPDPEQNGHEAVVARNSAILEEGYLYAAEYLKKLQPDILVGGHSFVMADPEPMIERYHQWAKEMIEAFQGLSPDPDYEYFFDPYWVKAYPYRLTLEGEKPSSIQLIIRNMRDRAVAHDIEIVTPEGISAEPRRVRTVVGGGARAGFSVHLSADQTASEGVNIVAFDISLDDRRIGQLFDMIVHVDAKADKGLVE